MEFNMQIVQERQDMQDHSATGLTNGLLEPCETSSATAADEQNLRVQLAGVYRIFAMLGWTELIYNHITVRIPGPESHFLINPFGLHYSEVTASNLVKIDLGGNAVGDSRYGVNPAGFVVHSTIHRG